MFNSTSLSRDRNDFTSLHNSLVCLTCPPLHIPLICSPTLLYLCLQTSTKCYSHSIVLYKIYVSLHLNNWNLTITRNHNYYSITDERLLCLHTMQCTKEYINIHKNTSFHPPDENCDKIKLGYNTEHPNRRCNLLIERSCY